MNRPLVIIVAASIGLLSPIILGQGTKKAQTPKKAAGQPAERRLTLEQIRKLIGIHTPDNVVAEEIQSRGISEDYVRKDVDQIRQLGGGPGTIAVMTQLLPVASITVRTEPGAYARIDNGSPYQADSAGIVTIPSIDPGRHDFVVEKQNFTRVSRSIELKPREAASINARLEWTIGFLTVTTNVPDARIQVAGGNSRTGSFARLEVPLGPINVVATASLRTSVSRTVTIEPGKEAALSIDLPLDQGQLAALVEEIHTSFRGQDYASVLSQADKYTQTGSRDKDVSADVAVSYLETGSYTKFQDSARQALSDGATVHLNVTHRHTGLAGGALHPADIELSAETFAYHPEGRCNVQPFKTPLKTVRVGGQNSAGSLPIIHLTVPDPANPKKEVTLELTARQSSDSGVRGPYGRKMKALPSPTNGDKVAAIREFIASLTQ